MSPATTWGIPANGQRAQAPWDGRSLTVAECEEMLMASTKPCPTCHGTGKVAVVWRVCGWCGAQFEPVSHGPGRRAVYCGLICAHEARKKVQRDSVRRHRERQIVHAR